MNIHFEDKELFEELKKESLIKVLVGSRMYGIHHDKSDYDYLYIYPRPKNLSHSYLWDNHQLQFNEKGVNHIFTDVNTFVRNILTGDSTINFETLHSDEFKNENSLNVISYLYFNRIQFYSFNIMKAYLGFAQRDLTYCTKKGINQKRLIHAQRCLYFYDGIKYDDFNLDCSFILNNIEKDGVTEIENLYTYAECERRLISKRLDSKEIPRLACTDFLLNLDEVITHYNYDSDYCSNKITSMLVNALENGIHYGSK